jgi:hypothetical protein
MVFPSTLSLTSVINTSLYINAGLPELSYSTFISSEVAEPCQLAHMMTRSHTNGSDNY